MSFHADPALAVPSRSPPRAGGAFRLQRKCACGKHTGGGECAGCRGDGLGRQPSRDARRAELATPAIIRGVLAQPGSRLDHGSRSFMESRFRHDFGRIRVHTDAAAAVSAGAVHARAYAIGDDLVFGAGEYRPRMPEGKRLLAHELTHTLQQTAARGPHASEAKAEAEAEENGRRVATGHTSQMASAVTAGALQRQGKPKTTLSGERTGTKEGKDEFGFKAEVKVPLIPELTKKVEFGEVAFLDDLTLTGAGSVTGEALGLSEAELANLKLQVALTLARLELARARTKAEALREGQLSLGATLSATDGATFSFNPFDPKRSLAASLTTKVSAATPSLLPSGKGVLTLGGSITGAGSVAQEVGGEEKTTTKAEARVGSEATFKSAPSSALSLGGVLGEEASITAGVETGASLAVTPEKTSGKLTAGGSLGLTGKAGGAERFIKIQVNGTIGLDQEEGNAAVSTRSVFVGASTGFKF